MGSPLDGDRRLDPQGVRRMREFSELHAKLQVDLMALTLAVGVGRIPTKEELAILEHDGRDLVVHARAMNRLITEIAGLWRQGKHHAALAPQDGDSK